VKVLLVLCPRFVHDLGGILVVWGAASCCYGALLALGRDNVRRQLGFLWVSAAGSVLAGIGTANDLALSGALFYDVTAALAITGLLLIAGAVEARLGTADMRLMGGLVRRTPRLATAYLLLGLAVVSFPGTAGFVSEHLFVQGLHEVSPTVAFVLLTATAVNGIALVRSYKRVFLGPPSRAGQEIRAMDDALPRESWVLGALVLALIVGWFVPTPLLRVREAITATLSR
jgi:NADH-quinone oxidoreductase subunit M